MSNTDSASASIVALGSMVALYLSIMATFGSIAGGNSESPDLTM